MDPHFTYREQNTPRWTRVDMLLTLFDGALERLEPAHAALERGDREAALPLLARGQVLVAELATGINPAYGELAINLLRLYEFATHSLNQATADRVEGALRILRTLRQGFEAIRDEAVDLERRHEIPPAGAELVHVTA